MKIVGIVLIIGILFVAAVIAGNRKAEAERKERLKHVFDHYEGAAAPKTAPKPETKPATPRTVPKPTAAPRLTRENITADQVVLQQHAMECYRDKNYTLALRYFVELGKAGHMDSQMYAAQMYYQGQGCEVNYKEALYWYERAAELGQRVGQSNVAKMYKDGVGCSADPAKALCWYEKAAEQGDDNAQLWAGMMYELGQGCTKDTKKACYWYEKAAAQGNANAKKLLSNMND